MKSLFCLTIILLSLNACVFNWKRIKGNGKVTVENRNINALPKIKLAGGIDIILTPGTSGIRVEADENIIPYIVTQIEDGWLVVKTKDNANLSSDNSIKVYVSTQDIKQLKIMGSGRIFGEEKFNVENNIDVEIAGSGSINLFVHSPSLKAEIMGSGNIELRGETRDVNVEIAGSGSFNGMELKAENAKVEINGSGDANIYAEVNLDASIAGSGDVKYKGNAAVKKHIAGSGSIIQIN